MEKVFGEIRCPLYVQMLNISLRSSGCLELARISRVCDLLKFGENQLKEIRGVGPVVLTDIKNALAEHGLELNPEDNPHAWRQIDQSNRFNLTVISEKLTSLLWDWRDTGATWEEISEEINQKIKIMKYLDPVD